MVSFDKAFMSFENFVSIKLPICFLKNNTFLVKDNVALSRHVI